MSDNELDAELLALAGDDSSDDDSKSVQRHSRSPSPDQARGKGKRSSAPARGVAQRMGAGRRVSRRQSDESADEGEA